MAMNKGLPKMASLEEVRALLSQKKDGESRPASDNAVYPHWNINEGDHAIVRFLPDGDEDNTLFWIERLMIKMPFQGIKGHTNKEVVVTVPCMEMYGETCPIVQAIKPWWKDPSMTDRARTYYKKKSYLFQGFVVKDALNEENVPENPIRRFVISPSIFELIKESLVNLEMEYIPIHYDAGRDFKIAKTTKGGYANYNSSSWSFKTRSLDDNERAAIDKHGLFKLKEFLPTKPSEEAVEAIKEMFEFSKENEEYDPDRWGKYYRPAGFSMSDNGSNSESETSTRSSVASRPAPSRAVETPPADVSDDDGEETPTVSKTGVKANAQDILARIKAGTKK